ncbi:universal stress protein [Arenibacter algicola]|uniref:Universal stress protein family protein n=1 Tax=Arenibacter algicola TaxID=616991 RepID=A0A221UZH8_9FLAO|nr:universal stress protein [Arenibacter algicola]ASO06506.1 universal stress protein family protein [Arenibacter algicola]|tara:strand:- start:3332 stop:4168 length:837 start_codon:yes stop_codon:yes gene_type:complete
MNKILVPVDFSELSEYALQVAATLAKRHNAEIVVLHMIGLSEAEFSKDELQEYAEASYYMGLAKKRFDIFLNRPWLKDIKISKTVQNYKIFSEIDKVAKENGVNLIVMGSQGTGRRDTIFLGSNTEKVVRTSDIPVLVLKKRIKDFRLQKMVLGFDFETKSLQAYHKVLSFCALVQANLHLVYVNLPGMKYMSSHQMKSKVDTFFGLAYLGRNDSPPKPTYTCDYSVEKGIYNHAYEIGADAITVITNGRSGLAHILKGCIGQDIANRADLPVVTFKV